MSSSIRYPISAPIADLFRWLAFFAEFPDIFEPPSGLSPERGIEHEINLLDPNAPIQNHCQYHLSKQELDEVHK